MTRALFAALFAPTTLCLVALGPARGWHGSVPIPPDYTPVPPTIGCPVPSQPSPPGAAAPTSGGPDLPGLGNPSTGSGASPSVGSGGPQTGVGSSVGLDLTAWSFWWQANQEAYLDLRRQMHSGLTVSGDGEFFLGLGSEPATGKSLAPSESVLAQRVVPALLAALEDDSLDGAEGSLLLALAKIGPTQAKGAHALAGLMREHLDHPRQAVRESATLALGLLGEASALPFLTELVRDTPVARRALVGRDGVSVRTRAFAAYALGLAGGRLERAADRERLVALLVELLEEDATASADLPAACVLALGLVPLEGLGKPETPVRAEEASAGRWQTIAYLQDYLLDSKRPTLARAHVPGTLAKLTRDLPLDARRALVLGYLRDWEPLIAGHTRAPREVEQSAIQALGELGSLDDSPTQARLRRTLLEATDTTDQLARRFALMALGRVAGREEPAGSKAREGLIERLLEELSRGNTQTRPWAALALGVAGYGQRSAGGSASEAAGEALSHSLVASGDPAHRSAVALALGLSGDSARAAAAMETLEALRDDHARGLVAVGLGLGGVEEAIAPLRAVVRDALYRPNLLHNAATALGLLGDKELVPELLAMLSEAGSLSSQASVTAALGRIGDARALEGLLAILEDEQATNSARDFAAVALGLVCDRDPRPWSSQYSIAQNYSAAPATLFDPTGATFGVMNIF